MSQTIMYLHIMTLVQTNDHQTLVAKVCSWERGGEGRGREGKGGREEGREGRREEGREGEGESRGRQRKRGRGVEGGV